MTAVSETLLEGQATRGRPGRLGIVLYSTPWTSQFRLGLELAKSALLQGYDVDVFAWGDAVYAATIANQRAAGDSANSTTELARLLSAHQTQSPRFAVDICTSCCKTRGLSGQDLIAGAHLSGMHKVVEMFQTCDRTLVMVP